MNEVTYDPELCHDFSLDNEESIKKSKTVGCFACCNIYDAKKIEIYSSAKSAICPNCHYNTVIPDHDVPIDVSFLHKMHQAWFSGRKARPVGKISDPPLLIMD